MPDVSFTVDRHLPTPVWEQIAEQIAGRIADGRLKPGDRLLGERDLAAAYGVAYETIRRVTKALREQGLVKASHGKGTFVLSRRGRESL